MEKYNYFYRKSSMVFKEVKKDLPKRPILGKAKRPIFRDFLCF